MRRLLQKGAQHFDGIANKTSRDRRHECLCLQVSISLSHQTGARRCAPRSVRGQGRGRIWSRDFQEISTAHGLTKLWNRWLYNERAGKYLIRPVGQLEDTLSFFLTIFPPKIRKALHLTFNFIIDNNLDLHSVLTTLPLSSSS